MFLFLFFFTGAAGKNQEMPRETNTVGGNSESVRDRHPQNGERDGNRGAPVEYRVEVAVARVVVLLVVPVKLVLFEQIVVETPDPLYNGSRLVPSETQPFGQLVEFRSVGSNLEVWVRL